MDGCLVNSNNEWDPLEEVIVGCGIPEELPLDELSFRLFYHDNIYVDNPSIKNSCLNEHDTYITKRHVHEHNEDVETFVELLKGLDIKVRRPSVVDRRKLFKTPNWSNYTSPALNSRDLCMVVGNTIIETPVSSRWRYHETDCYKALFMEYFKSGARWISAPKPLLLDSSYDVSRQKTGSINAEKYYSELQQECEDDIGYEIMFDAACCVRMGTHILFNSSNQCDFLGAMWLESILDTNYKIWKVNICDNHIDSSFLPLRPGLAIISKPEIYNKLPTELQKWDIIYIPTFGDNSKRNIASPAIKMNVLSINPELIVCLPEYANQLNTALKKYKIEVLVTDIRHGEIFGGGHHCLTLDIKRKGELENYF